VGEAGLYHGVLSGTSDAGGTQINHMPCGCYNPARMTLPERVQDFIERHALLHSGQELLAGVSGGADSMCMLGVLLELGYRPLIAHYDHGLRPESPEEAEAVMKYGQELGLKVLIGRSATGELERDPHGSLEAAARAARYRFFASSAERFGLDPLATGHTADDQAETVLLNLLRGTGPAGLRGMLPALIMRPRGRLPVASRLRVVRPLLAVTHAEAVAYCMQKGLPVLEDPSNRDPRFTRNRIRHELMPLLESFNPRVREALNRLSEIMVHEVAFIESEVETAWPDMIFTDQTGRAELSVQAFAALPLALQRGMLRRLLENLTDDVVESGLEQVERLRLYILDPARPRALEVGGSMRVEDAGAVVLFGVRDEGDPDLRHPQTRSREAVSVTVPGDIELANGWRIHGFLERPDADFTTWVSRGWPQRVVLDAGMQECAFTLRGRRPGDKLRLLGSGGTKKISDLMIDRKIPVAARDRWPLITAGGEIVWAVGLARGEYGSVSEEAEYGLVLELLPPSLET
jgi:tRNA(Ile)-lysidine synthase